MVFITFNSTDTGTTVKNSLNTNFTTAQSNLDTKVEFS